jgi:hypothetical protein
MDALHLACAEAERRLIVILFRQPVLDRQDRGLRAILDAELGQDRTVDDPWSV